MKLIRTALCSLGFMFFAGLPSMSAYAQEISCDKLEELSSASFKIADEFTDKQAFELFSYISNNKVPESKGVNDVFADPFIKEAIAEKVEEIKAENSEFIAEMEKKRDRKEEYNAEDKSKMGAIVKQVFDIISEVLDNEAEEQECP